MDNKPRVFGVDVSSSSLVVSEYGAEAVLTLEQDLARIGRWLKSLPAGSVIAMEATGSYHQLLAAAAYAAQMRVYVLNPRALKHYAEAIGQRGKTDPVDARMIARYAMHEQAKLIAWEPAAECTDKLSQLLQRRDRLVHASQMLAQSLAGVSALKTQRRQLAVSLKRMIQNVELLMRAELARNPQFADLHRRLSTIAGVGFVVAAQLVASLTRLRFARVESFVAFTGLDPRPDDSGGRRGRRKLSKRGPRLLRCLLYNAAMAAANSRLFKPLYAALRARGLRSTEAFVVLARKLARIAYALYSSGASFDPAKHLKIA